MTTLKSMYEDILLGRRQKFTQGTWELHYGGKENFKGLLRYLVFERLTLTREQFLEEISFQFLKTTTAQLTNAGLFPLIL
jgi:hypothetical protein